MDSNIDIFRNYNEGCIIKTNSTSHYKREIGRLKVVQRLFNVIYSTRRLCVKGQYDVDFIEENGDLPLERDSTGWTTFRTMSRWN